jgi:ABC-type glycerol-3-phosphate transport system substrate-binding protein
MKFRYIFAAIAIASLLSGGQNAIALAQSAPISRTVKVYVQGDTSRLADFVETCKREFANRGLKFELVSFEGDFEYNIVIAQESAAGGAAASVVVLDRKGLLVASVVRSGRVSGKGALDATAKELAKKLAILAPQ